MRIMYHKTDQTSFLYGLTRPSLGRCDPMLRLKLFLKKWVSRSPLFVHTGVKIIKRKSCCCCLTMMVTAVSRTLLPTIIGPLASSLTMIIPTAGVRPESVLFSQFTTTTTTITILPKTTSIIISKATIFIFFLERIITVPQTLPEVSPLIL